MHSPALYLRTLAHLKPKQLLYLPLRRVQRRASSVFPRWVGRRYAIRSEVGTASRTALHAVARRVVETLHGDSIASTCAELKRGTLIVLGEQVRLAEIGWEDYVQLSLMGYHLHYFDAAPALALAARLGDSHALAALQAWVSDWLSRCRPGRGPGWDPYPVSQRLVNWIWVDLLLSERSGAHGDFLAALRRSAVQHAAYLYDNLEYHLLANHLLKNLKAQYLASLAYPGAPAAGRWRRRARVELEEQIAEQILPDGAHVERSPMYHDAVLLDLLEVALAGAAAGDGPLVSAAVLRRMAEFHAAMTRFDGVRARFNDTAEGMIPETPRIRALFEAYDPTWKSGVGAHISFHDAGYFGYRDPGAGELLVMDAGPPGPAFQPAHAHCDLLSFELDAGGRSWIVDPGVHGYDGDPYRAYVRGTCAHNTLMLGGREQSEIWGNFRMARRALVHGAESRLDGVSWEVRASYSPYFDRRTRHERVVRRDGPGAWTIMDRVEGAHGDHAEGALHFHPDVQVSADGHRLIGRANGAALVIEAQGIEGWRLGRGEREPLSGWFFPRFGQAVACTTARYTLSGREASLALRLSTSSKISA